MSAILVLILRTLFAISLFAFLGWVIFVLWNDLQQKIKSDSDYTVPPVSFILIESGQEFTFNQPEFFIGRDPQANLHLPDDTLSAIHTRVYYKSSHWMIEDIQSTNGTFINGERLSTPSVLINGDEITCGQVKFQVEVR